MRPSPLYRRLGLTGVTDELIRIANAPGVSGADVQQISIQSGGGSDLSRHSVSTATVKTRAIVSAERIGGNVSIELAASAAPQIAARTYSSEASIKTRFRGRVGRLDTVERSTNGQRATRRGSTLTLASWSSILSRLSGTVAPTPMGSFSQAAVALFDPAVTYHSALTYAFRASATPRFWGAWQRITAADLVSTLEKLAWFVTDQRDGTLQFESLESWEKRATAAAASAWPLSRSHVLSPATWEAGTGEIREAQVVTYRDPVSPDPPQAYGAVIDYTLTEKLDWTTVVSNPEQWRRVDGIRFAKASPWRLPSIEMRLDHLIASPRENHRRAAGMLLALNVGDPIVLGADWPPAFVGVHYVAGISESITPRAWGLTVTLASYGHVAGLNQPAIPSRTWDQAVDRWDDQTTTWN